MILSFFTISDKRVNNLIVKLKKNILLLFALYENLVYLQRIKRSFFEIKKSLVRTAFCR